MSYVYDLRSTLTFALFGVLLLSDGLLERAAGEPVEDWLTTVTMGGLLCLLVLDGIQRRWRGDPGTREKEHDARTLAATTVGFAALVPIGLWSYWQGHQFRTWFLLVGGGLLCIVLFGWELYRRDE